MLTDVVVVRLPKHGLYHCYVGPFSLAVPKCSLSRKTCSWKNLLSQLLRQVLLLKVFSTNGNADSECARIDIGTAINSRGILWVSSVATVLQVTMWLLVMVAHARAVVKKQVLFPGKDEDHDS